MDDGFNATKNMNTGRSVRVISLDATKANDSVSNRRLLNKIESCDDVDPNLSWFYSCPPSKSQVVQVNGFMCEPRLVTSAVIQGSVLGRLPFLLYLSEVSNVFRKGASLFFTEDNTIF